MNIEQKMEAWELDLKQRTDLKSGDTVTSPDGTEWMIAPEFVEEDGGTFVDMDAQQLALTARVEHILHYPENVKRAKLWQQ